MRTHNVSPCTPNPTLLSGKGKTRDKKQARTGRTRHTPKPYTPSTPYTPASPPPRTGASPPRGALLARPGSAPRATVSDNENNVSVCPSYRVLGSTLRVIERALTQESPDAVVSCPAPRNVSYKHQKSKSKPPFQALNTTLNKTKQNPQPDRPAPHHSAYTHHPAHSPRPSRHRPPPHPRPPSAPSP